MREMKTFLVFFVFCVLQADAYPATYPFDKEPKALIPPKMPTPQQDNTKLSDATQAGYVTRVLACDPTDTSTGRLMYKTGALSVATNGVRPGFMECGLLSYLFNQRGIGAKPQTSNCTARFGTKNIVSSAKYSGMAGDVKMCEVGKCCSAYYGKVFEIDNFEKQHTTLKNMMTAGGCSKDGMVEAGYCAFVTMHYMCTEHYEGGDKRDVTRPCHNLLWSYFTTCPLFKGTTGLMYETYGKTLEPVGAKEQWSASQVNMIAALFKAPDRVCHPYSYYYPDSTKTPPSASNLLSICSTILFLIGMAAQA